MEPFQVATEIQKDVAAGVVEEVKHITELVFNGHRIELVTQDGATPFSAEHLSLINRVLEFYWSLDPRIVQGYVQFVSQNKDELSEDGRFPLNGENGSVIGRENDGFDGAIYFTKRGMDLTIPHRVSSGQKPGEKGFVDNFTGTVAHEIAHGGDTTQRIQPAGFIKDTDSRVRFFNNWTKTFGWKYKLIDNPDGKKTLSFFTLYPDKCIGGAKGYAATRAEEDICDSMAALILNPNILHTEKKEFLNQELQQIRENTEQN